MTSLVEDVARAVYDEFAKAREYGEHVSDYRFYAGKTCLDGMFDLGAVATAAISVIAGRLRNDPRGTLYELGVTMADNLEGK